MKCIEAKTGRTLIEIDVEKERTPRLITIVEGALVAILGYEKPASDLEWVVSESLYPKFEKGLGWIPEEGRHEKLFGIKVKWIGKENEA